MDKKETLALYEKGCEAWNAWAKEMLAQRAKLMETGQWVLDPPSANSLMTEGWITRALVDFSGHTFETDLDFSGFLFPGDAKFTKTEFAKKASFSRATFNGAAEFEGVTFNGAAEFEGVTFNGEAEFWEAKFNGEATFGKTTFSGEAGFGEAIFNSRVWFEEVTFSSEAGFWEATFSNNAWFNKATFSSEASFPKVTFKGEAGFTGATFKGDARFGNAAFHDYTGFNKTTFEGLADFSETNFKKEANFVAVKGQGFFTFREAGFFSVPDFEQAHFAEAPRLDHSSVQASGNEPDIAARWRALRRLATQGHDYQRELNFLADEIKSLRGVEDKKWPSPANLFKGKKIWPGAGRYWAGLFYQWLSDFGRSAFRPFLTWVILIFAFWLIYFSQHFVVLDQSGKFENLPITTPLNCKPHLDALYLSIHNGLVIPGLGRSETIAQSYACLYGTGKENQFPYPVVFAGLSQTVISTVLIFLFLLALRNYFRIK